MFEICSIFLFLWASPARSQLRPDFETRGAHPAMNFMALSSAHPSCIQFIG